MDGKKVVVLSSGGLDSTTVMAMARSKGYAVYSLTFNYGQRHSFELFSAKKVAKIFEAKKHLIIKIELKKIGGSALTDEIAIPKGRESRSIGNEIPITYVPARNTIFLSYAIAWAEVLGIADIFIGVSTRDYSGYPDCRPEFIEAFECMANLATRVGLQEKTKIRIHAPLIHMTKAQTIQEGLLLGVDYSLTHSCYDPSPEGKACGECDSCYLRKKGFEEAGVEDPTVYL